MEYDNAYFLATLDRNIYDAFDEDQIVRLINKVDEFADTLSNTRRRPAVAGVYNRRTGEFFFGVNDPNGKVPNLVTPLREYYDNMPDDIWQSYFDGTKGVGSHAEIWALNEALQADPSASIDDFLLYVIYGDKVRLGMPFLRCPHCEWITRLFYSIYK